MLLPLLILAQTSTPTEDLLMVLRPQLELQMTRECEKAVNSPDGSFLNLRSICSEISQPASVCLVEEISRQGSLAQVAREALEGDLGPASLGVASAVQCRPKPHPSWRAPGCPQGLHWPLGPSCPGG